MDNNNKQYWKGFDEFYQENKFEAKKHDEFAEKLPVRPEDFNLQSSRRDFLKFFGFSLSAAALTAACTKTPVKKAIPYVIKPVDIEPGMPNYYASTCHACSAGCSILVKTREGRPIKIEPNPESERTGSGTCALGQGTVLNLYDAGRLTGPVANGADTTWEDIDPRVVADLQKASSRGKVVLLSQTVTSPTTQKIINSFVEAVPNAEHRNYDHVSAYGLLKAHQDAFGKFALPRYRFNRAKTIVSFNADFLGTWISPVEYTKGYSEARAVDEKKRMAYHIQFESNLSLSGSNADLRMPMRPSQEGAAVLSLLNKIGGGSTYGSGDFELPGNAIASAANALKATAGESIVISGSNDPGIQAMVLEINRRLGNYGNTLDMDNPSYQKQGNDEDMIRLVREMNAGQVAAIIFYGSNPAYSYPQATKFKEALAKVPVRVSFADKMDETAKLCTYVCPDDNYLEKWNDSEPVRGMYTMTQPTITRIFNTRAAQETLLTWMGNRQEYHDVLKANWQQNIYTGTGGEDFESFWRKVIHDGVYQSERSLHDRAISTSGLVGSLAAFATAAMSAVTDTAGAAMNAISDTTGMSAALPGMAAISDTSATATQQGETTTVEDTAQSINTRDLSSVAAMAEKDRQAAEGQMELFLYQTVALQDGESAGNPWLQELPDPISRICWDNYVCVSKRNADEKGWSDGKVIKVSVGDRSVKLPVYIQPGQPYNTIAIAVGYGHDMAEASGKIANFVGKNAFPLASLKNGAVSFRGIATVEDTPDVINLAQTQTHHHVEGRDLVRETSLGTYMADPSSIKKQDVHMVSLYDPYKFPGHHWGIAIDLNACTGCGSCVVACTAENNVPVVGKAEVLMRREMHWIRIDRYFSIEEDGKYLNKEDAVNDIENSDSFENVKVNFQPLMCQHCDNAPCENVCPVAAISHSSEGINQQVYNRCVGTRYCQNNCPYKVRRFNWFSYYENEEFDYNMNSDLGRMVLNPDVVVRARGVMEKCSMCVQRIQFHKLEAKKENRGLKDGEIKMACQQACPANAIVFGDMNDPESKVSKLMNRDRAYGILTEIQTKPTVNYMAKIRVEEPAKA
ncbi:MAG: TAT-variant-translocated molybdopterin oxidoreductase [Bacteroidia bacterium]